MNEALKAFFAERSTMPRARVLRSADQLRAGNREMIESFTVEDWVEYCDVIEKTSLRMIESDSPEEIAVGELSMLGLGYVFESLTRPEEVGGVS